MDDLSVFEEFEIEYTQYLRLLVVERIEKKTR